SSTSQSSVIWFSPSACMSTTARSERPMRRWISCVRPDCLPAAASRRVRVPVERGIMPYSAVTQPSPEPRRQEGSVVSTEAVTNTRVLPKLTRQLPSACRATLRSIVTARIWLGSRPEGRMGNSFVGRVNRLLTLPPRRHNPPPAFIDRRFCLDGYSSNLIDRRAAMTNGPDDFLQVLNARSQDIFRKIVE